MVAVQGEMSGTDLRSDSDDAIDADADTLVFRLTRFRCKTCSFRPTAMTDIPASSS